MISNSTGFLQIPCTEQTYSVKNQLKQNNKINKAIGVTSTIWNKNGNINVTFGSYGYPYEANVSPDRAWSSIGSQTNNRMPGMNLGFIDPPYGTFEYDGITYEPDIYAIRNACNVNGTCRTGWTPGAVIIHEFCHALGMMHEHQNNLNNMNTLKESLNNDAVIKYYCELLYPKSTSCSLASSIDYSSATSVAYSNVLDYYSDETEYVGTNYDPKSIMHYELPDEWFNDYENPSFKNPTNPIFVLSNDDIEWLKQRYPLGDPSLYPTLTVKFIDTFDNSAKEAFKYDITTKYNKYCKSNYSNYCNEIRNIYNNLDTYANDRSRWELEYTWKMAWVQKIVLKTFTPWIGVNFVFKKNDDTILNNIVSTEPPFSVDTSADNPVQPSSNEQPSVIKPVENNYKMIQIISGVLGTIICLIILICIIVFTVKKNN